MLNSCTGAGLRASRYRRRKARKLRTWTLLSGRRFYALGAYRAQLLAGRRVAAGTFEADLTRPVNGCAVHFPAEAFSWRTPPTDKDNWTRAGGPPPRRRAPRSAGGKAPQAGGGGGGT